MLDTRREAMLRGGLFVRERADKAVASGHWQFGYYLIADEADPDVILHAVPYTAGPPKMRECGNA